jgi:hypothetical protein
MRNRAYLIFPDLHNARIGWLLELLLGSYDNLAMWIMR